MRVHEPASQAMALTSVVLPEPPCPITARFRRFWRPYTFMDTPRRQVGESCSRVEPEDVQNGRDARHATRGFRGVLWSAAERHEERNAANRPFSTSGPQEIDLDENVVARTRTRPSHGTTAP